MSKKIKIIALLLLICLCVPAFGCAKDSGTVLKIGERTLSLNTYEFLLSRMKGVLTYSNSSSLTSSYWSKIIDTSGKTLDEFYREQILKEAYKYVEALYMFDELGLTLPEGTEDDVNARIDEYIKEASSENTLNQELSSYGFNTDMLRREYIDEVKIQCVKEQLFGENGSKISTEQKEAFFGDNYVAFKQIFVATYGYELFTDANGDTVYYDANGRIAYDETAGSLKKDEFGNYIEDDNGDFVYYTEDGRIAYDTENGLTMHKTDTAGNESTYDYEGEELAEAEARARGLLDSAKNATDSGYAELAEKYSDVDSGLTYLVAMDGYYGSKSSSASYLDDIATGLAELKIGECIMVKSSVGYHIVRKYALEPGAYDKAADEESSAFSSFYTELIEELFAAECSKYDDRVDFDVEVYQKSLTMDQIGCNMYY